MEGYIKLHRQLLESSIFASQIGLKIWIWCLLKANFKTRFASIKVGKGESQVKVERGSFIFGRFKAEDELNIDGSTIYKWIKKLEEEKMILITSNSHYSIITICKYDDYQQYETNEVATIQQPNDSHSTAIQQPCDTTNNANKDNNVKNVREAAKAAAQKRVDEFKISLFPFTTNKGGIYSAEMVKAFFDYWSELNKSKTKMRWESEKTWETDKRLAKWKSNNFNKTTEKTKPAMYLSPEQDYSTKF